MPFKNTPTTYGSITKSFHWLIALLVIGMLAFGFYLDLIPAGATKITAYNLHKSLGITILILMLLRLFWHLFFSRRPAAVETLTRTDRLLSRAMHDSFYLLLIIMPMSGWLMSSAAGRTVHFFNLFPMPDLVGKDDALRHFFGAAHGYTAFLLVAFIALHAGAALKHHFVNKDAVLRRMLPLLALLLFAALPAQAQEWQVKQAESTIGFRATQMGKEFEGAFRRFTPQISFSPDNLEASKAVVEIDIASADTGSAERDALMQKEDWFDVTKYPVARFETQSFRRTGENAYEATALLTIRDITKPVTLPFTLAFSKGSNGWDLATMEGALELNRKDFNLGTGEWDAVDIIANKVNITLHIVAQRKPEEKSSR